MSAASAELFGSPQAAALYQAAARGDMQRARELLARDAGLTNIRNEREMTPLDIAMIEGKRKAFDNLLALGADPTYLGQARDAPIHLAASLEDPYWLKAMLQHGASTEARNALGETPLFPAVGHNTRENFRLLLEAGANVHARRKDGGTLLHEAASINSFADIPRLLELGVDPTARNDLGYTFQYGLFKTPENILGPEPRAIREQVSAWLRQRGIPIEGTNRPR